jgi:uncharacterized membrane protein (UPF0127 family)
MRFVQTICIVLFASAYTLAAALPAAAQGASETASALEPLRIVTSAGPQNFSVEVMRTDAERAKGLMYRRFLPADRGMLFDFKTEEPVMMWMKNTYIPLDMIFIARNGTVTHVAENAEPLSERIISSQGPAYAVLEVNGGTAARLHIKTGDRVEQKMFQR